MRPIGWRFNSLLMRVGFALGTADADARPTNKMGVLGLLLLGLQDLDMTTATHDM